jgi:crossover junction endodeoxyribonuclease RuvC
MLEGEGSMDRSVLVVAMDPGISGAVSATRWERRTSVFHRVASMPVEEKASGRRQIDTAGLFQLVGEMTEGDCDVRFVIERVSAMPGQGVSGMFSLGDSFGSARAIAACFSPMHPVRLESPAVWKKALGLLKKPKSASLRLARRLYPDARPFLARAKDEGRAEALLLAHYARYHLGW